MHVDKKKTVLAGLLFILILIVSYMACTEAKAEEPKGTYFAAISARYINDLGGGIGMGYQWKKSGVMLLGQVTYDQFNSINGTTPFQIGCRHYTVPYNTGSYGHRGIEFTVAIPLRKQ